MGTPACDYFIKVNIKDKEEALHWHNIFEIILVMSGQMDVLLNDKRYSLKKDDILVINCEEIHRTEKIGGDFLYARLHVNVEAFHKYLPSGKGFAFQCDPEIFLKERKEDSAGVRANIAETVEEFLNQETGYEKRILLSVIEILKRLQKRPAAQIEDAGKYKNKVQTEYMTKVFQFLYQDYTKKINLEELAEALEIGEAYLAFIIKDSTGMSFEELLNYIRCEYATKKMTATEMSLHAIANECGFSSVDQLNSVFKKFHHCTPGEYQKKNKLSFESQVQKEVYLDYIKSYLPEKKEESKPDKPVAAGEKVSRKSCLKGVIKVKRAFDLTRPEVQFMMESVQQNRTFQYIELEDLFGDDFVKRQEDGRIVMWVVIYQVIDFIIRLNCLPRIIVQSGNGNMEKEIAVIRQYIKKKYGTIILKKTEFIGGDEAECREAAEGVRELNLLF